MAYSFLNKESRMIFVVSEQFVAKRMSFVSSTKANTAADTDNKNVVDVTEYIWTPERIENLVQ
jgi:hypothetical protein